MAISEEEQKLQQDAREAILKAVINVSSRSNTTGEALRNAAEAYALVMSISDEPGEVGSSKYVDRRLEGRR